MTTDSPAKLDIDFSEEIVAPDGSPLGYAMIGVEDMAASLAFWRDLIGLDLLAHEAWHGEGMARHLRLPKDATVDAALLGWGDDPVGRVLLLDFGARRGVPAREDMARWHLGLNNLNVYCPDIRKAWRDLTDRGFVSWSEPVGYEMSAEAGAPTEVIIEGPDRVPVNLVELSTADPAKRIGQMRRYVESRGWTRAGFTSIVTTHHIVSDMDQALAFYEAACGMKPLFENPHFGGKEVNSFLSLPEDAVSRSVFVQGNAMFGKIALSQPLNFTVPDFAWRATPPNTGYLAQGFLVEALDARLKAAESTDATSFSPAIELRIPGIGPARAAILRNPASGALQALVETA